MKLAMVGTVTAHPSRRKRGHGDGIPLCGNEGSRRFHSARHTLSKVPQVRKGPAMIVDFQHHFTPRELIKEDPGDRLILHYDALGAPSYTIHSLLYDLDEHVRMMDVA